MHKLSFFVLKLWFVEIWSHETVKKICEIEIIN